MRSYIIKDLFINDLELCVGMRELNRLHLHYSPTSSNSYGLSSEYLRQEERKNFNFQWNHLLLRKNTTISQANLYLKSETGFSVQHDHAEPNLRLGLSGDWETRRYFVSYELSERYSGDYDDGSFHQKARLGIAPYIAPYGSLHTWLMLQFEHHPEEISSSKFRVTPLVRLFKGDYLTEFGIDDEKKLLFNLIVRY